MIVIDLGCAAHGDERSIEPLIERFHPDVLYGFDPWPESYPWRPNQPGGPTGVTKATRILIEQKAAWIYDGFIGYAQDGLRSRVGEMMGPMAVPCFDLAEFIWGLPATVEVVCKMDCEGAEAELIPHLVVEEADLRLTLLLVEWHDERDFVEPYDRADLIARLRCPVETWE